MVDEVSSIARQIVVRKPGKSAQDTGLGIGQPNVEPSNLVLRICARHAVAAEDPAFDHWRNWLEHAATGAPAALAKAGYYLSSAPLSSSARAHRPQKPIRGTSSQPLGIAAATRSCQRGLAARREPSHAPRLLPSAYTVIFFSIAWHDRTRAVKPSHVQP
jgi:hypothetical protein